IGDTGFMSGAAEIEVTDTKKAADGKFLHHAVVKSGAVKTGDILTLTIDTERRMSISRNHSATHLLQRALRDTLGTHVHQAGSYVTDERLRFDFSHFSTITAEELKKIEADVNNAVLAALDIEIAETDIESAKKLGAMALFGEKYGEVVRVVKMGDYSTELCGGCHLKNTSGVGLFKILSESGVAAGVRRIEAITGRGVLDYIAKNDELIDTTAGILKTSKTELANKAGAVMAEIKELQRQIDSAKSAMANSLTDDLIKDALVINDTKVITAKLDNSDADDLRKLGDSLKDKEDDLLVVLAGIKDGKAVLVSMATDKAIAKGIHAGNVIREVAKTAGGGGGGKPASAQAGAKDLDKIDDALAIVKDLIK
ncbi:MAG: alanine--tRNA ligase, partial [Clostridia bacterium]|nr:alanine--tRNA ligase [Clostridia bacterium]